MSNQKVDDSSKKNQLAYILIIFFTCLIIISLWYWNYKTPFNGTFGDKFGVVNTLFSGLAFGGIILTIYLQMSELKLQRKELEETRNVFEDQAKIMRSQQAESTFFQLLDNHRKFIDSFSQSDRLSGYEVIERLTNETFVHFEYYHHYINDHSCYQIEKLNCAPIEYLKNSAYLDDLVDNVMHLYQFVVSHFESTLLDFHTSTLLNVLSKNEKFLLTLYNQNILHNDSLSGFLRFDTVLDLKFDIYQNLPVIHKTYVNDDKDRNYLYIQSEDFDLRKVIIKFTYRDEKPIKSEVPFKKSPFGYVILLSDALESLGFTKGSDLMKRRGTYYIHLLSDYQGIEKSFFARLDYFERGNDTDYWIRFNEILAFDKNKEF